jgi:hypothetical protein
MNLSILPINVMLAQSKQWLTDAMIRDSIERHALGAAVLVAVQKAHDRLALQVERRRQHEAMLARLTERIAAADQRHDRKARALHAALRGLIEGTDDAELQSLYRALEELLFPEGLAIVNRSFSYQAGAIEALERRVTPEIHAQLEAIPLGPLSLASLYRDWVAAGSEVGKLVAERDRLLERTARGGSAAEEVDVRAARLQWVNTVQTFVRTLDLMDLGQEDRAATLSPLEAAVAQALRNRDSEPPEPGEQPAEQPGDDDGARHPAGDAVAVSARSARAPATGNPETPAAA